MSGVKRDEVWFTVGFAFLPKKLPRVLSTQLRERAAAVGLQLVALDPHTPLEPQEPNSLPAQQQPQQPVQQGQQQDQNECRTPAGSAAAPRVGSCRRGFDVVVHKLHGDMVWEAHLAAYTQTHPRMKLLDPLAAIHSTEDRGAMLSAIPAEGLRLDLRPRPAMVPAVSGPPISLLTVPGVGAAAVEAGKTDSETVSSSTTGGAQVASDQEGQNQLGGTGTSGLVAEGCITAGTTSPTASWEADIVVMVRAPPQRVVESRAELKELQHDCNDLQPPLIIKTRCADAVGGSGHGLAVATHWGELEQRAEELQGCTRPARVPGEPQSSSGAHAAAGSALESALRNHGDEGGGSGGGEDSWVPLVVQQYVPHSEALYKVYVLGSHVRVTRRATLTVRHLRQLQQPARAPQPPGGQTDGGAAVAGAAAGAAAAAAAHDTAAAPTAPVPPTSPPQQADNSQQQQCQSQSVLMKLSAQPLEQHPPLHPPGSSRGPAERLQDNTLDDAVLQQVALELSRRTGLTMFNFDVVVPELSGPTGGPVVVADAPCARQEGSARRELVLYVVDINYFPGYDKLDGWEALLVEHLRAAADRACAGA